MNEIATKDQERAALAKIRKMVEGLGPQSYLATAFEGCFQDAEENIENDFACSMAQRAEDAAGRAKDYADKADAYKKQAEDVAAENSRLKVELEAARRGSLPHPLRAELMSLMSETGDTARANMATAAENMAYLADTPEDIHFSLAVEKYRKARAQAEQSEHLLSALSEVKSI